ncbi:MAG TPA: glutamate racemase [Noviherbaspirillum sp.]|jgi:glutamate racemase|uniref:glutamate racemase n=1 Tax=Noviherbaspirillum sp. TaxID=1926288 RepID=UPI002DDDA582|nr:glutamate racemase [Noviherbaspirillum sp.]HEV2612067.1 glutamate racemase [Noviherbaspirillum sp.]
MDAIGVFDSGIGGLSVLRHIHACLPHERLLYFADSGFAPYGDKTEDMIVARSLAIAGFLVQQRIKALVVACNTATAAAITALRGRYPSLAVVGVEPGLKPAAAASATGIVGVLGTVRTLSSVKFAALHAQISAATGARFIAQPCVGLADQIEKGELQSAATVLLVRRYVEPLLAQGADTIVLGCTHYAFVQPLIMEIAGRSASHPVTIIDTGEPVARQLVRLLESQELLRTNNSEFPIAAFTTGSENSLMHAFSTLLKLHPSIARIDAQN